MPNTAIMEREVVIDQLVKNRMEHHDGDILEEAFREGRIGYNEMDNETLAEIYFDEFNRDITIDGKEPDPTIEIPRKVYDAMRAACLSSLGVYEAVKLSGLDKHLPGYESCLQDLEAAVSLSKKVGA